MESAAKYVCIFKLSYYTEAYEEVYTTPAPYYDTGAYYYQTEAYTEAYQPTETYYQAPAYYQEEAKYEEPR